MKDYFLEELLQIKNGRDHKHIADGDIPIYGSGGIMRYGNQAVYDNESILLPRKGTLSNIQFVDKPFWTVDTIYYTIINKEKANPLYLYYYLKQLNLSYLNSGTGVPSMTFGAYYGIKVNLPHIETQQKISKVLSDLDTKIEVNNKINTELEAMAKTLYDYWFVQFDFPVASTSSATEKTSSATTKTLAELVEAKPYKTSGGKMVWNDDLKREIPEGWEDCLVNELLVKYSDKSLKVESKQILNRGKYPVITQDNGDFIAGYTNLDDPIQDVPLIVFGDHSCTLRYVDFPFFRGADGTQLMMFVENKILYMFLFLLKVINQIPGYGKYERHYKYLKDFKVILPPDQVLNNFHKIIKPIFNKISKSREENQELASLRDWLLPMLMNGQVTVASTATHSANSSATEKSYEVEDRELG